METMVEKKLYEGMFLVDSTKAASDWDGTNAAIKRILDRTGAEIHSMRKWDDRKLAYDIKGTSRGTYILCYFKADGQKIQDIEKAVHLSEKIIRVLILNTDQMTQEDIEKDTPAIKTEKEKEKAVAEKQQKIEAKKQDHQQQEPAKEQAQIENEAQTAENSEQTEQAEEPEKPVETDKKEEAGQAEDSEAEEQQDSQPKVSSDD